MSSSIQSPSSALLDFLSTLVLTLAIEPPCHALRELIRGAAIQPPLGTLMSRYDPADREESGLAVEAG
jgi:hypothetical protein